MSASACPARIKAKVYVVGANHEFDEHESDGFKYRVKCILATPKDARIFYRDVITDQNFNRCRNCGSLYREEDPT